MKKRMGTGRFFMFALGAPAGERCLALAIVGVPAFLAPETLLPFALGQEPKAINVFAEYGIKFLLVQLCYDGNH